MKATLEFDLNDPEDRMEHQRAVNSLNLLMVLWEMDQYLRSQVKYNEHLTEEAHKAVSDAREKLYEIMNENAIFLDNLMQ